ncbi:MAG: hypothetical protein V1738_04980 [Patescibacteria group bacterium]
MQKIIRRHWRRAAAALATGAMVFMPLGAVAVGPSTTIGNNISTNGTLTVVGNTSLGVVTTSSSITSAGDVTAPTFYTDDGGTGTVYGDGSIVQGTDGDFSIYTYGAGDINLNTDGIVSINGADVINYGGRFVATDSGETTYYGDGLLTSTLAMTVASTGGDLTLDSDTGDIILSPDGETYSAAPIHLDADGSGYLKVSSGAGAFFTNYGWDGLQTVDGQSYTAQATNGSLYLKATGAGHMVLNSANDIEVLNSIDVINRGGAFIATDSGDTTTYADGSISSTLPMSITTSGGDLTLDASGDLLLDVEGDIFSDADLYLTDDAYLFIADGSGDSSSLSVSDGLIQQSASQQLQLRTDNANLSIVASGIGNIVLSPGGEVAISNVDVVNYGGRFVATDAGATTYYGDGLLNSTLDLTISTAATKNITITPGSGDLFVNADLDVDGDVTADYFWGDGRNVENLDMDHATLGTLVVARGGTGLNTVTANGVLYGDGTNALKVTSAGADATMLMSVSGTPTFVGMSGDVTIDNTGATTIGALKVLTGMINDLAVTTGKIADLAVTTGKIADANVTSAKIANDAVTLATQTTGDYVATASTGSGVTVTGGTGEASTPSFALGQLTADWVQDGNFNVRLGQGGYLLIESESSNDKWGTLQMSTLSTDQTYTFPTSGGTIALTGHSHATADITSGVFAVERGGTGQSSFGQYTVILGNSGNSLQESNIGTDGKLLLGQTGNKPQFMTMSGDATITAAGVMAISADSVVLGTDTSGNYVASLVEGNGIDLTGSAGEGWSPTVAVDESELDVSLLGGSLDLTSQVTGVLPIANGGTGGATAGAARTNLGLAIGTDVQAWDTDLDSWSAIATSAKAGSGANSDITSLSGLTTALSIAQGGTGATTAGAARTALGLAIGTDVQAYDAGLLDIAGLAVTDGNFIVGDGANWIAESGATARTSLGLGNVEDTALSTWAGSTSLTTLGTVATGTWNGTAIAVANGGTGATDASTARTNLGLAIGTDVQAYSANLAAWSALATSSKADASHSHVEADITDLQAYLLPADIGVTVQAWDTDLDSWSAIATSAKAGSGANSDITSLTGLTTALSVAQGGTGVGTFTSNGVLYGNGTGAIQVTAAGTNGDVLTVSGGVPAWVAPSGVYQASDAGLTSISGLTTAADTMIYTTALDTYATATLTSFARTLLDDADASTAQSTLGLAIGTNVQAWDTDLDSWSAIATSAKADSGANTDITTLTQPNWSIDASGNFNGNDVILAGNLIQSAAASITAYAGGGQTNATALTEDINEVSTVATAADSVKLPAITADGMEIKVINHGASALDLFPASGETIAGNAADTAVSLIPNETALCMAFSATTWECVMLTR